MLKIGDVIEQYKITAALGEGAYGQVFAAENLVNGQTYALKTISKQGTAFRREENALRRYSDLHHPNLLRIHHVGCTVDMIYYTMDLAEGTLESRKLSPGELRTAAAKLADALMHLHEKKLLHRDIKPGNLLWVDGEPVLGDIGLVTRSSQASFSGTPGFIPPPVWKGKAALDETSDLYALAKSFYCLLSGNSPGLYPDYRGDLGPDSSVLLNAIIDVCDEPGVIRSAAAFREALLSPPVPHRSLNRTRFLRRTAIAAAALACTAAVFFSAWFVYNRFIRHDAQVKMEAGQSAPPPPEKTNESSSEWPQMDAEMTQRYQDLVERVKDLQQKTK